MDTKDWITLLGFVFSFVAVLLTAIPQIKRIRSQKRIDEITTQGDALELIDSYQKKFIKLQEKVDNMEAMLEGSLHLVVKIPLGEVFKNGSSTIDGVVAEIVKQKS